MIFLDTTLWISDTVSPFSVIDDVVHIKYRLYLVAWRRKQNESGRGRLDSSTILTSRKNTFFGHGYSKFCLKKLGLPLPPPPL